MPSNAPLQDALEFLAGVPVPQAAAPEPTLKDNDIIDIITHDGAGRRAIRRVRVLNLTTRMNQFVFSGVNMQGQNPRSYRVSRKPCDPETLERRYDVIGWIPFDNSAEADE